MSEAVANICSACFSKLGAERLECEFCHDPDVRYCSKECRSALGWAQHQDVCNVVHSTELVAVPYAWQTMTQNWHEQQHKFPAYIIKNQLTPTQVQQTLVPSIVAPKGATGATPEAKTKAHTFHVEVNGVALKRLQAPDAMISEHSANSAAQCLASTRIPRTEGRTYWVSSKDLGTPGTGLAGASGAGALRPNEINEFRLVRGTGDTQETREVRVHLVGAPVAHFEEQVKSRLGTGLRHFLKEQYKYKGLSGPADVAATYYGVNPETRDTVTFSINKELQLVDLEFYAPKVQEPVSLRRQTYETAFDDQDPHCVQALIMALAQTDSEDNEHIRVLEEHHRRLTNPSVNIEGDISHLIRVRTAVSASLELLQEHQELIGKPVTKAEWTDRLLTASKDRMFAFLTPWAKRLRQLVADREAWELEESERSDFTAGRSLGFRKKVAGWRAKATERSIKKLQDEIRVFQSAVDNLRQSGPSQERLKDLDYIHGVASSLLLADPKFTDFGDFKNIEVRKFGKFQLKGPRTEAELRYFREAPRKPVGAQVAAAAPIGGWLIDENDPNKVMWFNNPNKRFEQTKWDKQWLEKPPLYGEERTKNQVLEQGGDTDGQSEDQLFWRYDKDIGKVVRNQKGDPNSLNELDWDDIRAFNKEEEEKGDAVVRGGGGMQVVDVVPGVVLDEEEEPRYSPSVPADHPAGKRNYYYGAEDVDEVDVQSYFVDAQPDLVGVENATLEELVACSFPLEVMAHPNFDWMETPAVLSDYPEHVEALRGQALIGARDADERRLSVEEKELRKNLAKKTKQRRVYQRGLRRGRRADKKDKRGQRMISGAGKERSRADREKQKALAMGEEFTHDADTAGVENLTVEELIACSFPREVMLNPNFDWRTTPAVLSNYPGHVEALRGQTLIGDKQEDELKGKWEREKDRYNEMKNVRDRLEKDMTATARKRDYFWKSLHDYKQRLKKGSKKDSGYHTIFDGGDCSCSSDDEDDTTRRPVVRRE